MSNTLLTNFLIELKNQTVIWYEKNNNNNKKWRKLCGKLRSSFIFKQNHVFIENKDNPSEEIVIVVEQLDGIGNLEDSPRLFFIDKECENLKVFVDGGDLTRNINEKKSDFLQAYRYQLCDRQYGRYYFINKHADNYESVM